MTLQDKVGLICILGLVLVLVIGFILDKMSNRG